MHTIFVINFLISLSIQISTSMEPVIFVKRFLQTPMNWLDLRPILIHASPGHRLMESRKNAAVLDASIGNSFSNDSMLHLNPYSKQSSLSSNFLPPVMNRFSVVSTTHETPIISTLNQKNYNRYAQIIPVQRLPPLKIKRAQPRTISNSGMNRLVPLIDTRNLDSIEMDFDKDFQKLLTDQFHTQRLPSRRQFFDRPVDSTSISSGTEDEPFTNDLESFLADF